MDFAGQLWPKLGPANFIRKRVERRGARDQYCKRNVPLELTKGICKVVVPGEMWVVCGLRVRILQTQKMHVHCTPTNYVDRKHLKSKLTTKIHLKSMLTKKTLKKYVDKKYT